MDTIKCPNCGKEVNDLNSRCTHCGQPLPKGEPENNQDVNKVQNNAEKRKKISKNSFGFKVLVYVIFIFLLTFISTFSDTMRELLMRVFIIGFIIGVPIAIIYSIVTLIRRKSIKKALKHCGIFASVIFAVFVASVLGMPTSEKEGVEPETQNEVVEKDKEEKEVASSEEAQADDAAQSSAEQVKNEYSRPYAREVELFNNSNYPYITASDLGKYYSNMSGVNIYTIITVEDINENNIQTSLSDGYMFSEFCLDSAYTYQKNYVHEGDKIAIMGTVDKYDSYGFMGTSVKLKNCIIFADGNDAFEYDKGTSDSSLSQYFVLNENVANSTNADLTESEFKGLCKTLDYNDILRNPDNYNDKYCVVSGRVSQIIEGMFNVTLYITDSNGNQWGCTYIYKDGESHLLENDSVTVYGKCDGTATVKTVLGKQVILPRVDLEYIN